MGVILCRSGSCFRFLSLLLFYGDVHVFGTGMLYVCSGACSGLAYLCHAFLLTDSSRGCRHRKVSLWAAVSMGLVLACVTEVWQLAKKLPACMACSQVSYRRSVRLLAVLVAAKFTYSWFRLTPEYAAKLWLLSSGPADGLRSSHTLRS